MLSLANDTESTNHKILIKQASSYRASDFLYCDELLKMDSFLRWDKLPLVLAIILFSFVFLIRYQQGGWDINLDLFPQIRQSLDQRIEKLLPSPQAELLSGILLGNKKNLPGKLKLALRDSSTLHIVVVSGQNLTLLAGLFLKLSGLFKRKIAILVSIAAIIFYTLLTGAQVPVLRSAVMALLAFGAEFFGRQKDGVRVLIITAATMLLINPRWATDLSFQLSFLATFGVVVVSPVLEERLKFLPSFIKQDLAISFSAELMIVPIIIQNFHQLSVVGVFANLLVGWTIPLIMIAGALMLLLGSMVSLVVNVFLTYFIYIVEFFANFSFAWEYVGEQVWVVWAGYYLILGGMVMALAKLSSESSDRIEKQI